VRAAAIGSRARVALESCRFASGAVKLRDKSTMFACGSLVRWSGEGTGDAALGAGLHQNRASFNDLARIPVRPQS
jgi:hypothetical protein